MTKTVPVRTAVPEPLCEPPPAGLAAAYDAIAAIHNTVPIQRIRSAGDHSTRAETRDSKRGNRIEQESMQPVYACRSLTCHHGVGSTGSRFNGAPRTTQTMPTFGSPLAMFRF